jgi:glutaredoxin 3
MEPRWGGLGMAVKLYSTMFCADCRAAEALLEAQGIEFEKIDVSFEPAVRQALIERADGWRTMPVIFLDEEVIGGYAELVALAATGTLRARLGSPDEPLAV